MHDQLYNVIVSGAERETMVHLKDATPFDIVRFIFSLGKDQRNFKIFQTHGDNLLRKLSNVFTGLIWLKYSDSFPFPNSIMFYFPILSLKILFM